MDTAQFLTDLRAERNRIDNAITALESLNGNAVTTVKAPAPAVAKAAPVAPAASGKRVVSPEARQRMAEAQQKRWAKKKRAVKAAAGVPAAAKPAVKAAPVIFPIVKKVGKPMSAATKKKLALAAKAQWAAKTAVAVKTAN
jgi:hypothetical protein